MMAGLLYKDFVAVHGKRIALGLVLVTVLLMLFCVFCTVDDIVLLVGGTVIWVSVLLPLTVPMYIENAVFTADTGKKKKAYLFSLPVSKRQQVAEKYVFVGIAYYVVLSATTLWGIFISGAMENVLRDTQLTGMLSMIPLYIYICLILSALEMPFFVVLGVKAGNALKQGIFLLLFFFVAAYMLFGDLGILENWDLMSLAAYMQEHMEVAMALQTFFPIAALLIYYLSYRIAGALYAGKELKDEE